MSATTLACRSCTPLALTLELGKALLVAGSLEHLHVSTHTTARSRCSPGSDRLTPLRSATYLALASSLDMPSSFFHALYLYLAVKLNAPGVSS